MHKEFILHPLNGAGPVRLGASREAVLAALGVPEESFYKTSTSRHRTDAWYQGGLQVSYTDAQATVVFVEFAADAELEAVLFGRPVFATPVSVLIPELVRRAKLDETDPELGYSYIFPSLALPFWRPDNDDAEAPCFATVGIGVAGYQSE